MRAFATLLSVTVAVSAMASTPPQSGTASGSFRLHNTTTTFVAACAYRVPDDTTPGAQVTEVLLATIPLDCAAANASFDPVDTLKQQISGRKPAFVTVTVGKNTERLDGGWESAEPYDTFGFGGQGTPKVTVNTETRTEGRYASGGPQTFFDKTFEFDFSWAADVLGGALTGTSLPADGGEPGAAYRKYVAALAAGKIPPIRALLTKAEGASLLGDNDKDAAAMLKFVKKVELKTATIDGGLLRDDTAALNVSGTNWDGDTMRGRVIMRKEDGAWKVSARKLRVVFE